MKACYIKKINISFLCLLFFTIGFAQDTYTGKVVSASSNENLTGVTVMLKGTARGSRTDADGNFSIRAKKGQVLEFSFLGLLSKAVVLGDQKTVNISMEENTKTLDDVVVIGYGTVKKRDLTGSVASVSAEKLKDASSVSFGDALRGKLSGVLVTSSGGEPGAGLDIRIRGINSISASSNPLYVVDGVPIESNQAEVKTGGSPLNNPTVNPLSYIDPNNIASIEVLKDASAAAIYGSRGANGVILITTKSGVAGKAQITFSPSTGISYFNKRIELLDAYSYSEKIHLLHPDNPLYTDLTTLAFIPMDSSKTINWQDELYQNASVQNYNLGFSNNTDRSKLFMSLGYNNTEGIIKGSKFQRLSFLINADTKLSDRLSVVLRSTTGFSNRFGQLYGNGQGASGGITLRILTSKPFTGNGIVDPNDAEFSNPVDFVEQSEKLNKSLTNLTNVSLNYKINRNWNIKILGGGYITNSKNSTFLSKAITNTANSNGLASLGSAVTFNWLNENTLNYNSTFGNHKLTGLLGFTQQQNTTESFFLQATNFPIEINGINAIQDALSVNQYGSEKTRWALRSYLGRINYGFKDRYQFTLSLRADGSSKFYGRNKYSYFPAAAFAWQVGDEKFIKNLNVFDDFKMRLSYGLIGNQSIPPYSALSTAGSVRYFSGSTQYNGASTQSVANPDLTWETSETYNAGLDFSFMRNRVTVTVDAYIKNTKDLLLESPVAGSSGFSTVYQNVGSIQNKGFEIVLGTVNFSNKNFKWNTDINFNLNRNKVISLGTQDQIITGLIVNSSVGPNIIKVGSPLGSLYGFIFDGVYKLTDFEANGTTLKAGVPVFGAPLPGKYKYRDISGVNGKADGFVNEYDRTIIGNSNPKHFGGIRNTFSYKRLSLSAFISWQYGNDILNWSNTLLQSSSYTNSRVDYYRNMWSLTNQESNVPISTDALGRQSQSTFAIQNGSFLRIQNVSLKYVLSPSLLKRAKITYIDISLSADNLAVFHNYNWYDPELTSPDPQNIGVDFFSYPRPKTYTIGVNVRF